MHIQNSIVLPWFNVLKTRSFFLSKSIRLFGKKLLSSPSPFGFFSQHSTESLVNPPELCNDELICVCCLFSVRGIVGKQNAVFPFSLVFWFPSTSLDCMFDSEGFVLVMAHTVPCSRCSPDLSYISPPSFFNPAQNPYWCAQINSIFCFASLLAAQIHWCIICILEIWRLPFMHSVITIKRVPDKRWRIKSR